MWAFNPTSVVAALGGAKLRAHGRAPGRGPPDAGRWAHSSQSPHFRGMVGWRIADVQQQGVNRAASNPPGACERARAWRTSPVGSES